MTANQRRIIRDYLLRRRWYFIAGFVIHLILMTACWWVGQPVMLGQSVLGAGCLTILLPLALRFGWRLWTTIPAMMFAAILSSLAPFLWDGFVKTHWPWLLAGLAVFLLGVWWATYRLLGTPHPWRAGAMKGLAAGRRM